MNYLAQLKNKHIIVLGLGVSGLSTVQFLLRHDLNPKVVDSRVNAPGKQWLAEHAPQLDTHFGDLALAELSNADLILISPGIALAQKQVAAAINAGVEVIGDIELFARLNSKPVIAVTGSNGKSSVVTLTAQVLTNAGYKVGLGGNIGTPILDLLQQELDVYVLELSSFQLETTASLVVRSATVLNISEDHLDRYSGMAQYIAAKHKIYDFAELAVYNRADQETKPNKHSQMVSFAQTDADFYINSANQFVANTGVVCELDCLAVTGIHNQLNALAVIALLSPWDIKPEVYQQSFSEFSGLAHRCQLVAQCKGVRYFNDSKATNVGAAIASISSFATSDKNIILIAGGDAKGADLTALKPHLDKHVKQLICLGQDGDVLATQQAGAVIVDSMARAVKYAHTQAKPQDIVLLAPACASIDMYANYMARGDDFKACVLQLTTEEL